MHRRRNWSGDNRMSVQPPLKIVRQVTSGAVTSMRISFQAFRANCFQVAIQPWRESPQFRSWLLSRLLNGLERVLTHEWRLPGQKVEQDGTQTVDIGRRHKLR